MLIGKIKGKIFESKEVIILLVVTFIFIYSILDYAAVKTILSIFLFWLLPMYSILSLFELTSEEKVFLSFFSGIIIIPSLVYWSSFVVPLRISTYIVPLLLAIIGIFFRIFFIYRKSSKVDENT